MPPGALASPVTAARRLRLPWAAAAAGLSLAAAAATVLFTLGTVFRLHVPLPFWDEWYLVRDFRAFAAGTYGWRDLAAQHNEHRLLVPRLFFFADDLLFGLSGTFDLVVIALLQFVTAAILVASMRRRVARPAHRALLTGFVLLMLFTLGQEQNFSSGFQLQFVGVFTAAALAAVAYAAALQRVAERRRGSAALFALAGVACAASTYTMANGVLAGAVLAAAAVLRGAPWRVAAATGALAALLAALFFRGYVPGPAGLPLSHALAHPLAYLRFVTAYLGNPLGTGIRTTQALGTLGLALAAAAAWRVAAGRTRDAASLALLIVAGFSLASAAATAYGRAALGTQQAFESRYETPSLIFWTALVLFWFPVATRRPRAAPAAALGALMALLAGAALWSEATAWPALAERSAALRRVSDSLVSGLYDAAAAAVYEVTPMDDIAVVLPFLRERRLAAFAAPEAAALGRPLAALGPLAGAGACEGSAAARPDPALGTDGVRLRGWVREGASRRAPRRIVVADAPGTVVGVGSASLPGEPSRLWSGYARGRPGDTLRAYALLADGGLCGLGDAAVPGG